MEEEEVYELDGDEEDGLDIKGGNLVDVDRN